MLPVTADQMQAPFDPGISRDGNLELRLADFTPHPAHKSPSYYFRMVDSGTGEELGTINLRIETTPHIERHGGHIGYAVYPAHRGRRYAARSVRLLIPLAERLAIDPVWITCDPENLASRRTLGLAGAESVEIVDVPKDCIIHQRGHPRKCRYRLRVGAPQAR